MTKDSLQKNLLPCKYCIGKTELTPHVYQSNGIDGPAGSWRARCPWTFCPGGDKKHLNRPTKEHAIEAWNFMNSITANQALSVGEDELQAENFRYRLALERISNQAVCVGITPVNEHGEMLGRIYQWTEKALTSQPTNGNTPETNEEK